MPEKRGHYIRKKGGKVRKSSGDKKSTQHNYLSPIKNVPDIVIRKETILFSDDERKTIWSVTKASIVKDEDILADNEEIILDAVIKMPLDIDSQSDIGEKYEQYYLETVKFHAYSEHMELGGDSSTIKKLSLISKRQSKLNAEIEDIINSEPDLLNRNESLRIHNQTKLLLNSNVRNLFEIGE